MESGVPQGSVLGPTLFLLFINDIDLVIDITNAFISKFADDTKMGRAMISDNDRAAMQKDIDKLVEWAETWQMEFNSGKCKVMHLGSKNPGFHYTMGGLAPGGRVLEETPVEKDVGVIIQSSLKPSAQCVRAAKRAKQTLGQMSRALHFRDKVTWVKLYVQYCRSHMEYCVQSWSPWLRADIDLLSKREPSEWSPV